MITETEAQAIHDQRLAADLDHDRISCWCCCTDCEDFEDLRDALIARTEVEENS
jgi:hypothetical protein